MKPGRLQNALKSFGRTSKCFKILWPDAKMLEEAPAETSGDPETWKKASFFRGGILITGTKR